jgi:pyruvate dehydrogenase E1 component alpha subunit
MLRIRKVEQRLSKLFADKEVPGFIHLSIGQESVPVGISRHLREDDTIAATHRGHGQALAKGVDLNRFVAEMMGRQDGICRGRGGSMHIAEARVGMLGANGIVGGGMSIATGSALAHKLAGNGAIAVCYFGDGALAEGLFHECLNLAALWSLPILFACENNGWGEFSRTDRQFCGRLEQLAAAFDVRYRFADGLDVLAVSREAGELVAQMRSDRRPAVLECRVERFHGHFEGDPQKYRDPAELAALAEKDPLAHARAALARAAVDDSRLAALEDELDREIEAAVEFGRASPQPDFASARADVYAH